MAYVNPALVVAPRASVRSVEVLHDTGAAEDGWSLARLGWEGSIRLGIRWNGGQGSGIGNPQSRGNPTWFVLPQELEPVVLEAVEELASQHLYAQYRELAADKEREAEALEWSEALIGDASA